MAVIVNCEICGVQKELPPSLARKFRTCSHKCGAIRKSGGALPKKRICKQCGKTQTLFPDRAKRPFCSRKCYSDYMRVPSHLHKKRDPEARRVSHRKSMTKKTLEVNGFDGPVGDLTTDKWKIILSAFNGKCAYCGEIAKKLTMDHIVPASKGGKHIASNVVPSCAWCNQSKKDKLLKPKFYPSNWDDIKKVLGVEEV